MSRVEQAIAEARRTGDFNRLAESIPYAAFLGISLAVADGEMVGTLRYEERLIGNILLPALHGGTIGALLETTAIFTLMWGAEGIRVPKTINITVEYLRTGHPRDTFARAAVIREGRRIASVRAEAWQEDPGKLIATATANFLLGDGGARGG